MMSGTIRFIVALGTLFMVYDFIAGGVLLRNASKTVIGMSGGDPSILDRPLQTVMTELPQNHGAGEIVTGTRETPLSSPRPEFAPPTESSLPLPVGRPIRNFPVAALNAAAERAQVSPAMLFAIVEKHLDYGGKQAKLVESSEDLDFLVKDLERYAEELKSGVREAWPQAEAEEALALFRKPRNQEDVQQVLFRVLYPMRVPARTEDGRPTTITLGELIGPGQQWSNFTWSAVVSYESLQARLK